MATRRSATDYGRKTSKISNKGLLHRVFGRDEYGAPVEEEVRTGPRSWRVRLRDRIMRHWPARFWHVAYRLGLTKARYINKIEIEKTQR